MTIKTGDKPQLLTDLALQDLVGAGSQLLRSRLRALSSFQHWLTLLPSHGRPSTSLKSTSRFAPWGLHPPGLCCLECLLLKQPLHVQASVMSQDIISTEKSSWLSSAKQHPTPLLFCPALPPGISCLRPSEHLPQHNYIDFCSLLTPGI